MTDKQKLFRMGHVRFTEEILNEVLSLEKNTVLQKIEKVRKNCRINWA